MKRNASAAAINPTTTINASRRPELMPPSPAASPDASFLEPLDGVAVRGVVRPDAETPSPEVRVGGVAGRAPAGFPPALAFRPADAGLRG